MIGAVGRMTFSDSVAEDRENAQDQRRVQLRVLRDPSESFAVDLVHPPVPRRRFSMSPFLIIRGAGYRNNPGIKMGWRFSRGSYYNILGFRCRR